MEQKIDIEALRAREEAGELLSQAERGALLAFYTQIESEEMARISSQDSLREDEKTKQEKYLENLEAILIQKRRSLQQLEKLIQEIEMLQQEENKILASVSR